MFIPTIKDIKNNIKVNNDLIETANQFIYDNAEKEGDFVFQYNCISKLLEYKRKTLLNALIIKGMIWSYLLNGKEEDKRRKFWLYVKLYNHTKVIKQTLENIRMLKGGLVSLQIMMNPLGALSLKKM